jgi:hypothetical protein
MAFKYHNVDPLELIFNLQNWKPCVFLEATGPCSMYTLCRKGRQFFFRTADHSFFRN